MKEQDIYKLIRKELSATEEDITIADGVTFNHRDTVNKITAYKNSQFTSGAYDSTGRRKFFYNISKFRARTVAKMLDFDQKDMRVLANKGTYNIVTQLKAKIIEIKLRLWMKKEKFGEIKNTIAENLADYGSVILKKGKKSVPTVVDITSVHLDPSAEKVRKSSFIIEEYEMSPSEMFDKIEDGWDADAVEEAIDKFMNEDEALSKIKVYERHGKIYQDGEYKQMMHIVAGATEYEKKNGAIVEKGVILFEEEEDEMPYRDAHINKVKNRWLGVGTYEDLFDAQVRANEIANLKARSMELSSMQLYQTPNNTALRNILTDLENGSVLSESDLTRINNQELNLGGFSSEEERYDLLADRLTFTFDAIRGESIPATTPATNALLQNNNALQIFEFMREGIASFLSSYLEELVLPDILKKEKGMYVTFSGTLDDLNEFDNLYGDIYATNWALSTALSGTGFLPADEYVSEKKKQALEVLKQSGKVRSMKLPKDFFKGAMEDVTIHYNNEATNIGLDAQNILTFTQLIASNPDILMNPVTRKLVQRYAELVGISPADLEFSERPTEPAQQLPQGQGQQVTQNQNVTAQPNIRGIARGGESFA